MQQLKDWLDRVGLADYYEALASHKIDLDIIPHLTPEDLERLGLPLGDRIRFQKAAENLRQEGSAAEEPPRDGSAGLPSPARNGQHFSYLTVVFVDLVGSTALSERLDAEEYRDVISAFQACCAEVVGEERGFLAQYVGDGALAYFGYPRANEDDAERAVSAALKIIAKVPEIGEGRGLELAARVGAATGRVLVGDLERRDSRQKDVALGDIPNLAARLQGEAEKGTAVISHRTRELLGNNVECAAIGRLTLKGFSAPVAAWKVLKMRPSRSRFDSRLRGALTPLCGRGEEISILQRRWRSVAEGQGQVVILSGEPGIGKSRLLRTLLEDIAHNDYRRLSYQCSPFHRGSAFYPIINQLTHASGMRSEDAPAEKLAKLEALLSLASPHYREATPLLARLLSIPLDEPYELGNASTEVVMEHTRKALVGQALALSKSKPLIIVFEDIQWIDPSSEELLGDLIEQIAGRRILVICSSRPEYSCPWVGKARVTTLALNRLDDQQARALVKQVCAGSVLDEEILETIVERAEGVPIFLEELGRTVLDTHRRLEEAASDMVQRERDNLTLPTTVNELLMARLDSLEQGGDLIPVCAAIGRSFSFELLAEVVGKPQEELREVLSSLVQENILLQRGDGAAARYTFRHALIQEAAYSRPLRGTLRRLHAKIGDSLRKAFPEESRNNPEELARHYSLAERWSDARDHWAEAADLAVARAAYIEAIGHLQSALEMNERIEEEESRKGREIALREQLVVPLEARFWGSKEIAANLDRLYQLHAERGDEKALFGVLDGLYGTHIIAGSPDLALGFASEMEKRAVHLRDPAYGALSLHAEGMCHFMLGEFGKAMDCFSRALPQYAEADQEIIKTQHLADVRVIDRCMLAWTAAQSGSASDAAPRLEEAVEAVRASGQDFSQAYGYSVLACACQALDDPEACGDLADLALQISRKNLFPYWEAWAGMLRGWARGALGEEAVGLEELKTGMDRYAATGSKQILPYAKCLMIDILLRCGRHERVPALLEELQALEEKGSVRFHRRYAGELEARLAAQRQSSLESC